jgi:hypothetical protein
MAHFIHLGLRRGLNLDLVTHWVDTQRNEHEIRVYTDRDERETRVYADSDEHEIRVYTDSDEPTWRLTGQDREAFLAYMTRHATALHPPRTVLSDDSTPPF